MSKDLAALIAGIDRRVAEVQDEIRRLELARVALLPGGGRKRPAAKRAPRKNQPRIA